jgi:hypothetical protein
VEQLRPVELKLIDELFGMSSGYVLDFTNSAFADFFRREVGIDVYDNAYGVYGGSKGKHLRAFVTIGQPRAIARALTALPEYHETDRLARAEAETVVNARQRLNAIVERLGGASLASYEPATDDVETKSQGAPRAFRADEAMLQRLEARFFTLHEIVIVVSFGKGQICFRIKPVLDTEAVDADQHYLAAAFDSDLSGSTWRYVDHPHFSRLSTSRIDGLPIGRPHEQ